jgi:hypothetical protein
MKSPTEDQMRLIQSLKKKLGLVFENPKTSSEARFVIDDLLHKERQAKGRAR